MVSVKPPIIIQVRHPRARKDYICQNCGGLIPKGLYHDEEVVRLGEAKYKDPLVHWRKHSDCQAPWWQPWEPPKLTSFGRIPKRVSETATDQSMRLGVFAEVKRSELGHVLWFMPPPLSARLFSNRREDVVQHVTNEADTILALTSEALLAAAGNRKLAMQLSHLYDQMRCLIRNQAPPKKRVRKPKLPKEE